MIKPQFDGVEFSSNGLALVRVDDNTVISTRRVFVIEPQFDFAYEFSANPLHPSS